MTVKYLGFSGKKQSGKDTAAGIVQDRMLEIGRSVAIFPFAKPLKDMCHELFGIPKEKLYGTDKDKSELTDLLWDNLPLEIRQRYSNERSEPLPGFHSLPPVAVPRSGKMTIREVLQVIGTDIFRARVYDRIWVEAPFRRQWADNQIVILPDCRFPNEVEAIEKFGGLVIRVERASQINDTHPSETALDNYKFSNVIRNNGTLEEFEEKIFNILNRENFLE